MLVRMDIISAALGRRRHAGPASARLGGERGQSIIEFVISLPLLLILVFGVWNFYSYYSRVTDYQNAARTLAEWIGRTDCYSSDMGSTIATTLGSNVYAYVAFENDSGSVQGVAFDGEMPKASTPSDAGVTPNPTTMCHGPASATQVRVVVWSNKLNIIRFKSPLSDADYVVPAWSSGTAVSAIIGQTPTGP